MSRRFRYAVSFSLSLMFRFFSILIASYHHVVGRREMILCPDPLSLEDHHFLVVLLGVHHPYLLVVFSHACHLSGDHVTSFHDHLGEDPVTAGLFHPAVDPDVVHGRRGEAHVQIPFLLVGHCSCSLEVADLDFHLELHCHRVALARVKQ